MSWCIDGQMKLDKIGVFVEWQSQGFQPALAKASMPIAAKPAHQKCGVLAKTIPIFKGQGRRNEPQ